MEFKLSVLAEDDIMAIAEQGIAMFGPVQAKRYHAELFNTLDLIAKNPQMARAREEFLHLCGCTRLKPTSLFIKLKQTEQFL